MRSCQKPRAFCPLRTPPSLHPCLLLALFAVCVLLPITSPLSASVTVQDSGNGFRVTTATYQCRFDANGALVSLSSKGEQFIANASKDRPSFYFYRGQIIQLDKPGVVSTDGAQLVARGAGVQVTWEFSKNRITAHLKNSRRTPVKCFILFQAEGTKVTDGQAEPVIAPVQLDTTRVDIHRGDASVIISGGDSVFPFRKNQTWVAELKRGESRQVSFVFSEADLQSMADTKTFSVAAAGEHPVIPWRNLQYTPEEIETIRQIARTENRFRQLIDGWFERASFWMSYSEEDLEALFPKADSLFSDATAIGDPRTNQPWPKRGEGMGNLQHPGEIRSPHTGDIYGTQKPGEPYYDDGKGWVRPEDGKRFYFVGTWNSYLMDQLLRSVQVLSRVYMLTGDEAVGKRVLYTMDKLATLRAQRGKNDGPVDWPYPIRENQGFFSYMGNQANTRLYQLGLALDIVARHPLANAPSWSNSGEGGRHPSVLENIRDNLLEVIEPESMQRLQNHGLSAYSAFLTKALLYGETANIRRGIGAAYGFLDNCVDRDGEYYEVSASYVRLGYGYGGRMIEVLRNYSVGNYSEQEQEQAAKEGGFPVPEDYPYNLQFGNDPRWLGIAVLSQYRLNVFNRSLSYGDSKPDRKIGHKAELGQLTHLRDAILYVHGQTTQPQWKKQLAELYWSLPPRLRARPTLGRGSAALWQEPERPATAETSSISPEGSILMGGKLISLLRDGNAENARALFMRAGHANSHANDDQLALALYGRGMLLTGEFGYGYWGTPDHVGFGVRAASHKTVVVDEDLPSSDALHRNAPSSSVVGFLADGDAQFVHMSNPSLWPRRSQVSEYNRQSWLVHINEKDFYILDIFRVSGGKRHDYIWNTAFLAPAQEDDGFSLQDVSVQAQQGVWTLASHWNQEHRKEDWNTPGRSWGERVNGVTGYLQDQPQQTVGRRWNPPPGNGYGFYYNVKSALTELPWSATWELPDTRSRLKLSMLNPHGEETVVTANSPTLTINTRQAAVIARRKAAQGDPLVSRFVSLAQVTGKNENWPVASVRQLPLAPQTDKAVAVLATLDDGKRDILISSMDADLTVQGDSAIMTGGSGFIRLDKDGSPEALSLYHGKRLEYGDARIQLHAAGYKGQVREIKSSPRGSLVYVNIDLPVGEVLKGSSALFDSPPDDAIPYANNVFYNIVSSEDSDKGGSIINLGTEQLFLLSALVVEGTSGNTIDLLWPNMTGGNKAAKAFSGKELIAESDPARKARILDKLDSNKISLNTEADIFKPGERLEVYAIKPGDLWEIPAYAVLRKSQSGEWIVRINISAKVQLPAQGASTVRVLSADGRLLAEQPATGEVFIVSLDPALMQTGDFILETR